MTGRRAAWASGTNEAPQSHPVSSALPAADSAGAAPYSEQMKAATTMAELQAVWRSIPADDRDIYLAAKDKRKAELQEAAS